MKQPETQENNPERPPALAGAHGSASLYSTVPLPDGIVIGGPWPHTIISWPGGKSRGATKPEYDLFQALEAAHAEIERLRAQTPNAKGQR